MNKEKLEKLTLEFCGNEKIRMAEALNLPYRTFQDYVYGKRKIPDHVIEKAREVVGTTKKFMKTLPKRVDAVVSKQFPNGIVSDVEVWE